jgi:hypothetical protein
LTDSNFGLDVFDAIQGFDIGLLEKGERSLNFFGSEFILPFFRRVFRFIGFAGY